MKKNMHPVCLAATCLLLAIGCGASALNSPEAEKAIRSLLQTRPLALGVKLKKLDKLEILSIIGSDEAAKIPTLADKVNVTAMKDLQSTTGTNIYFVSADIDGTVTVDAANVMNTGASGTTKLTGAAWFMITKDNKGQIKALLITMPKAEEE